MTMKNDQVTRLHGALTMRGNDHIQTLTQIHLQYHILINIIAMIRRPPLKP